MGRCVEFFNLSRQFFAVVLFIFSIAFFSFSSLLHCKTFVLITSYFFSLHNLSERCITVTIISNMSAVAQHYFLLITAECVDILHYSFYFRQNAFSIFIVFIACVRVLLQESE